MRVVSIPRISYRRGRERKTYIFETVEILVSLAASLAVKWLLLLHAESSGIWCTGFRIHNGECAVSVFVQLLRQMAVRFMISVVVG